MACSDKYLCLYHNLYLCLLRVNRLTGFNQHVLQAEPGRRRLKPVLQRVVLTVGVQPSGCPGFEFRRARFQYGLAILRILPRQGWFDKRGMIRAQQEPQTDGVIAGHTNGSEFRLMELI